ncbi:MAG: GH3 auxin-responsive promoter family protein [Thermoproteota archaeon]|nr:GH3 auxin-responsive promoter family protein [Candidatus Brockarchaeota archaeon]
MTNSADLWREYCSFYEKPFEQQLEINEALLKEHLARWGRTAQAKILCPNGFQSINDIPVTSYKDYPVLLEFKKRIESLEKSSPRMPGELYWDYYDRIGRLASKSLSDYLIGDFSLAVKTSGTTSEPKWIPHGNVFWENFRQDVIATTLIACSNSWGITKFEKGDRGLNFTASAPFLTGWGRKASQGLVIDVPPVSVMDEISEARRRFFVALEYLKNGHNVNLAGGIAPSVYLMCEYFSNPETLFEEYYRSMDFSFAKFYLLQKWAQAKFFKKPRNLRDYLNLKGLMIGGVDTALYADYIKTKLEVDPLCIYGVSELGIVMFGSPDRKGELMPNLRSCYFEFRDEKGVIVKIDEIKPGCVYDLIVTPFGGLFSRYDVGDTVLVVDVRDDGMPVFRFWGRKNQMIAIRGFLPRVTEALAVQIMARAGLSLSDKWAFTKSIDKHEKILVLMENTWGLQKSEAERRIFQAFLAVSEDFRHLVAENHINDPNDIIEVEYLKPGAFLRYAMERGKRGVPMGQIKPPKIIPPERQDICEDLRRL